MKSSIANMDVLQWAREYDGEPFHAMLCDPPYHLTNRTPDVKACTDCGRVLGGADGKPDACPRCGGELINQRSQGGRGFMSKEWDGGDLAFKPETWAALGEHLYPGAFMMCFAGTRGYHRMACAIEDAGFIIHPALGWLFSTGFPKATRLDTQIDKAAGVAQTVVGQSPNWRESKRDREQFGSMEVRGENAGLITEPATPLAKAWQGHRYGLQAIKPSFEFVCVAQKPYKGRPVDSITSTGAGALWIDGGRIGSGAKKWEQPRNMGYMGGTDNGKCALVDNEQGRWPANFCCDEEGARRLDLMSGVLTSGNVRPYTSKSDGFLYGVDGKRESVFNGDSGGASRFFLNTNWNYEVEERLFQCDPVSYTAKADRNERNAGCEHLQPQEWIDGAAVPNRDIRPNRANPNNHPTVKPISLTKWLATLLLPPIEYAPRRILVPFSGVGSEMIGCALAGWEVAQGIEQDSEYVRIAEARLRHYDGLFSEIEVPVTEPENERCSEQLTLHP